VSDDASADDTDAATSDDAPPDASTTTDAGPVRTPTDAQTVVVCCDGPAAGPSPATDTGAADDDAGDDTASGADIEGEEDDTTSTQMRHWLTNDLLAAFLHLTLVAVVLAAGLGHLDLAAIPPRMRLVFLGTVLSATVWSFGEDVLQSIRGS
jgi:hypothetical protein